MKIKKIGYCRWACWCVITAWLSVFVATATNLPKSPQGGQVQISQASGHAGPGQANPKIDACPWCYAILLLVIIGLFIWVYLKICAALRDLGHHINDPPDKSNSTLPVTAMPITQGTPGALDCALGTGLFGAPNGSELLALPGGLGYGYYDGTKTTVVNGHPIDWTGAGMLQFSILSSTNLQDWPSLCTVVEWVAVFPTNASALPTNIWVCQAAYTNSVAYSNTIPVATNGVLANVLWLNIQPTYPYGPYSPVVSNATVYGTLTPVLDVTKMTSPKRFFQLYCNTNATDAQLTIGP